MQSLNEEGKEMKNRKIAWILVIVLSLNMVGNDQAVLALGDTMEDRKSVVREECRSRWWPYH